MDSYSIIPFTRATYDDLTNDGIEKWDHRKKVAEGVAFFTNNIWMDLAHGPLQVKRNRGRSRCL